MQKRDFWTRKTFLYRSQASPVVLCMQYSVISTRITTLYGFQPSSAVFYIQNCGFRTNIACLYGSQTYPVILCLQNIVPSISNTNLYGSQPSSVVFTCKTDTSGLEKHVSMGPRHHLSFCACNKVWLVPESLVSIGPSPHVWFSHAKQPLLDQNNKSLWAPDITCRFVHAIQRDQHQNY